MELKRLKILPVYFRQVLCGDKRAELRLNDRDFQVGDIYELAEFDGVSYTGRCLTVKITHVLRCFDGLQEGYCMFSFELLPVKVNYSAYHVGFCPRCDGTVWQIPCESHYCFRCGLPITWANVL